MSEDLYKQELYKTLTYSNEQFDKQILFIASGALGVSFAFIDKLIELRKSIRKELLIDSWYLLSIVILIALVSHFISLQSIRWSIANYENEVKIERGNYKWNLVIRVLNVSMMIGLFAGVIRLIQFINLNI